MRALKQWRKYLRSTRKQNLGRTWQRVQKPPRGSPGPPLLLRALRDHVGHPVLQPLAVQRGGPLLCAQDRGGEGGARGGFCAQEQVEAAPGRCEEKERTPRGGEARRIRHKAEDIGKESVAYTGPNQTEHEQSAVPGN